MPTNNETEQFLQALFPDHAKHAIFAHSKPGGGMAHTRDVNALDATRDCYWCIAAFPDDGKTTRSLTRAIEVRALVIDDVGTKVPEAAVERALGRPTAAVETSAGNFQWAYRLSEPVAVKAWPAFFAEIERRIGVKLEGRDAVHLFRLPMGVNTKPTRDKFDVHQEGPSATGELPSNIIVGNSAGNSPTRPGPSGPRVKNIRNLMASIPNDISVDREAWVRRAHQVKALAIDEAEGWEAFDAWSRKWPGYDEAATRTLWDSIVVDKTSGLGLLEDAEAADHAEFTRVMNAEASAVFDDGVAAPPSRRKVAFALGEKDQILSTMDNAARALWGLGVECRYDEFHHRFHVRGERLTDHMVLLLRVEVNGVYGKDFGDKHMLDAITALGLKNGFNPVVEMLAEAEAGWDGVKRLDRLGPDYFHTEDTPLAHECFRRVMIAAVRRARRPGCKFDQILVLESPEGWDKSTAWRVLAGDENFSDASILGKDARAVQEELADIWIHEIADLSGLARAEVEAVKAFASRQVDRARPAYGKVLIDQPRQSIEVGTTNSDSYLMSQTGNRRFWTFRLGSRVDIAKLRYDRVQLWGEAAAAESAGETLVLDRALWDAAAVAQEDRRVVDPWEDELANLPDTLMKDVGGAQTITNVAIHDYLGGHRGAALNGTSGRKIAEIMKRLGWERARLKDAVGQVVRGYKRVNSSVSNVHPSVPKNPF
jgi:predicted P-loop ATPase